MGAKQGGVSPCPPASRLRIGAGRNGIKGAPYAHDESGEERGHVPASSSRVVQCLVGWYVDNDREEQGGRTCSFPCGPCSLVRCKATHRSTGPAENAKLGDVASRAGSVAVEWCSEIVQLAHVVGQRPGRREVGTDSP